LSRGFLFYIYYVYVFFLFICLFNKQSLSHQFMTATKRTRRGGRCLVFIYFIVFIPRAIIFQGVESNFLCQPLMSAPTGCCGVRSSFGGNNIPNYYHEMTVEVQYTYTKQYYTYIPEIVIHSTRGLLEIIKREFEI